jgi:Tfp pilus assembly protein PilF
MNSVVVALTDMVIDPEQPMDLTQLSEGEALALIKQSYAFLSSALDVSLENGIVTIRLPDEPSPRVDEARKWYRHGVKSAELGDYKRAIQLFKRVLERLPHHAAARRNLAMAYLESGDKAEARNELIHALRVDPKDAWSYMLLGNIHSKYEKNYDRAEPFYRRAYELNPNDAILLANYGALMVERGHREQAEEFFERAVEANPQYANGYCALALLDLQSGKPAQALDYLDRMFAGAVPVDVRSAPLFSEARRLYREANRVIARDSYDRMMAFLVERKQALERETGYPIQIIEDSSVKQVWAITEVAWAHHRSEHRIRYRLKSREVTPHLIAHELEHLALEEASRRAGRHRFFATSPRTMENATRSLDDYLNKRRAQGYPKEDLMKVTSQLIQGLANQLLNMPLDMILESRLYQNDVPLRPSQFVSLYEMSEENVQALTNQEIKRLSPPRIYKANITMNCAFALFLDSLYGPRTEYAAPYRPSDIFGTGKQLFEAWQKTVESFQPGDEYALVDEFARVLKLQDWFEWTTDPEGTGGEEESGSRSVEAPLPASSPQGPTSPELLKAKEPATVMYLLGALERFNRMSKEEISRIGTEIGILGMEGIDYTSSDKTYTLRALPGETFTGLQLLALMYVAFQHIDPLLDIGVDFKDAYALALKLRQSKSG